MLWRTCHPWNNISLCIHALLVSNVIPPLQFITRCVSRAAGHSGSADETARSSNGGTGACIACGSADTRA